MLLDSMLAFVLAASGQYATTYGYGEEFCGSPYRPALCDQFAITASGEPFDPEKATAAVAVPSKYHIRPGTVMLRLDGGKCAPIRVNDRMNDRYVNTEIRWDLSPAAVKRLGGEPSPSWRGRVHLCIGREIHGGKWEWEQQVAGGAK